jgi:hypothetical protein
MKTGLVILAIAIAGTLPIVSQSAQASYIVTLDRVGSDVVATGSGAIDLTGLSFFGPTSTLTPFVDPEFGVIGTGPVTTTADFYIPLSTFSGPTSFGSQFITTTTIGGGDWVSISGSAPSLALPHGYVSGGPLSDTATYDNATFRSLGVTPGTYVWTWGTGANQNFTLDAVAPAVPDSGSTFGLLFVSLVGLLGAVRFRLA